MAYYIKEGNWKQIFSFLKSVKGIHSKSEEKLRTFMEAVWYMAKSGCQWRLLPKIYGNTGVYTGDLKGGVKRKFWKSCLNIHKSQIWKST